MHACKACSTHRQYTRCETAWSFKNLSAFIREIRGYFVLLPSLPKPALSAAEGRRIAFPETLL